MIDQLLNEFQQFKKLRSQQKGGAKTDASSKDVSDDVADRKGEEEGEGINRREHVPYLEQIRKRQENLVFLIKSLYFNLDRPYSSCCLLEAAGIKVNSFKPTASFSKPK